MNEEYGVEPEFFRTAGELKFFLSHFGMMEGRFIAEFPRSWWSKRIYEHVSKNLSGIERTAAVVALENAKRPRKNKITDLGLIPTDRA